MPTAFDCKTITIDHVVEAMRRLQQQYQRTDYSTDHITRETMRGIVGDQYYHLSTKERKSAEGKVRRLLKKEEDVTGRVRDTCWKSNKSRWKLVTKAEVDKEKKEAAERKTREDRIKLFCGKANIDPDDVDFYLHNVRFTYEDFERLMKHYG